MEEKRLNADEANECRNNIIDILNNINNVSTLKYIYIILETYIKK